MSPTPDEIKAAAMGAATDPPKTAGRGRARSGPSRPPVDAPPPADSPDKRLTPAMRTLREGILDIYTSAQMVTFMFDPYASKMIEVQKEACADAWIELASRDAKVKAMLIRLTTGSAWGGVIMAHMTMIFPILARRGIIPGGALFGGNLFNAMADPPPRHTPTDEDMAAANTLADELARQGFVPFDPNANGVG